MTGAIDRDSADVYGLLILRLIGCASRSCDLRYDGHLRAGSTQRTTLHRVPAPLLGYVSSLDFSRPSWVNVIGRVAIRPNRDLGFGHLFDFCG